MKFTQIATIAIVGILFFGVGFFAGSNFDQPNSEQSNMQALRTLQNHIEESKTIPKGTRFTITTSQAFEVSGSKVPLGTIIRGLTTDNVAPDSQIFLLVEEPVVFGNKTVVPTGTKTIVGPDGKAWFFLPSGEIVDVDALTEIRHNRKIVFANPV